MKRFHYLAVALQCICYIGSVRGQDALFSSDCWSKLNYFRSLSDHKFASNSSSDGQRDRTRSFECLSVFLSILATTESSSRAEFLIERALNSRPNVHAPERFGMDSIEWSASAILPPGQHIAEMTCAIDKGQAESCQLEVGIRRSKVADRQEVRTAAPYGFERTKRFVDALNLLGRQNSNILDRVEHNASSADVKKEASMFLATIEQEMLAVTASAMIDLSMSSHDWDWIEAARVQTDIDWSGWRKRETATEIIYHRALPELTSGRQPPAIEKEEALLVSRKEFWRGLPLRWRVLISIEKTFPAQKQRLRELKLIRVLPCEESDHSENTKDK